MYVDFSWVVFDDIIFKSQHPKAAWLKLTEKNIPTQSPSGVIRTGTSMCSGKQWRGTTHF